MIVYHSVSSLSIVPGGREGGEKKGRGGGGGKREGKKR